MNERLELEMTIRAWLSDSYTAGVPLAPNAYMPAWLNDRQRRAVKRALVTLWTIASDVH